MNNRINAAFNRIKNQVAFTLAEALVAVLILLLVTSIIVAGIPAALRAYDNVVIASNAEVLLSTTMSALRNELSTAKEIKVASGNKTITYYNQAVDAESKIYIGKDSSDSDAQYNIMYQQYKSTDVYTSDSRLVSKEASDTKMELHVTYSSVTYNNGIVSFSGLVVKRKNGKETPAKREIYSIRVISDSH